MDPNSPYQAPQADLTQQPELQQQPDPTPLPEAFPRVLPAIVGVGATMTFWVYVTQCTLFVLCSAMLRLFPIQQIQGLHVTLQAIEIFVIPWPLALGIVFLSQVPEETGAKASFKLSWILLLGNWIWLIIVANEKKSEPIPPSILWSGKAIGQAYILALYWGCFRLSKFCADDQMRRWARIALGIGLCSYLILLMRNGWELFWGPDFFRNATNQEIQTKAKIYEGLFYAEWAGLLPTVYCFSKALLRIEKHAETEAARNVVMLTPLALPAEDAEHQ